MKQWAPVAMRRFGAVFSVCAMIVIGAVLVMGWVGRFDSSDAKGFQTGREVDVGLLTGVLIGGALLLSTKDEKASVTNTTPNSPRLINAVTLSLLLPPRKGLSDPADR